MNKLWIPAAVIAVLLLSSTAHAQQTIGSTTSVTPSATGNYGGNQRTLQTGTSVYHQENIQTGDTGRTAMRFHDNSNLQVGRSRQSSSTSSSTIPTNRRRVSPSRRRAARSASPLASRIKVHTK
jgi:hypothetical protein